MNRRNLAVTAIALLAVFLIASGLYIATRPAAESDVRCYGILGAMPEEVGVLLDRMDETDCQTVGSIQFHIGTLAGKNVVVAECGIGKVNAAMCTQLMITRFNVTAVINSGVAGTLDAHVGIGDIVVSTETVQHDYDIHEVGYERGLIPNDLPLIGEMVKNISYENARNYLGIKGV